MKDRLAENSCMTEINDSIDLLPDRETYPFIDPEDGIELMRSRITNEMVPHVPLKEISKQPDILRQSCSFDTIHRIYGDGPEFTASNFFNPELTGELYVELFALEYILCNPEKFSEACELLEKHEATSSKAREILIQAREALGFNLKDKDTLERVLEIFSSVPQSDGDDDLSDHPIYVMRIAAEMLSENPTKYSKLFSDEGPTAGDECTRDFPIRLTTLLDLTNYPVDTQRIFLKLLSTPKYREMEDFLRQRKDSKIPWFCAATTVGTRADTLVDLAIDPFTGEISETKLISVSPKLHAGKQLGKGGFITKSIEVVTKTDETYPVNMSNTREFSREIPIVKLEADNADKNTIPDIFVTVTPTQAQRYFEPLVEAGFIVKEIPGANAGDRSNYSIELPEEAHHDPIVALRLLDSASALLSEKSEQVRTTKSDPDIDFDPKVTSLFPALKVLDIDEFKRRANYLSWPGDRGEGNGAYREFINTPENRERGEVAFFDISGFGDLRNRLSRYDYFFEKISDPREEELLSELIADAVGFAANRVSQHTIQGRFRFENIEVTAEDKARFITNHNIIEEDKLNEGSFSSHPEIFQHLYDGVALFSDPDFKEAMAIYLAEQYSNKRFYNEDHAQTKVREVAGIILKELDQINFKVNLGLISCEVGDDFSWYVSDNPLQKLGYQGGRTVYGSPTSAAAREASLVANANESVDKYIKERKYKIAQRTESEGKNYTSSEAYLNDLRILQTWEENKNSLLERSKGSNIILQKEVAQAFGLIGSDSLVLEKVEQKGVPEISLVVIPVN